MKQSQFIQGRLGQISIAFVACIIFAIVWKVLSHPIVAIGFAAVPALVCVTLRQPFLMVLGFVIFSFFRIHEVFPQLYPLHIPQLLAVGSIASLGFNFMTKRVDFFWRPELTVFSLFFFHVTAGLFLATNRGEAMSSWSGTYVKIAIMVFAIAWLVQTPKTFKITSISMVCTGILVGIVTLYNKSHGIGLVEGTRVTIGRDIGSMLGDPNDLSLVLLFPASFALALLFTPKIHWFYKGLGLISFFIILSAIIATQSRGGILGIAAVSAVYGYRKIKNKALFFTLGIVAVFVLFILAGVSSRASGGAHEAGIDESAMGRIHAWGAAFSMALHHPIGGVGINNFLSNYFMYSDFWDGRNHAVHSTWFGVLAETGFLGLGIFATLVFLLGRSAYDAVKALDYNTLPPSLFDPYASALAQSVLAGLLGFCISGTFLTMGFTWPIYILLSLIVAISHFASNVDANCFAK